MRQCKGLTLIELMTVLGIIAVLAAIAWPLYDDQRQREARADGVGGLGIAAMEMENCLARNGTYTGCPVTTPSPRGHYAVAMVATNGGAGFTLTATKNDNADADCGDLSLNHLGQKTHTGTAPMQRCWPS
ncbi:MAG: prepilin-type N-terminal cleavage/methylation domain-containing protein [Pseudomonadota bacterium]|nr:MAG: prepilin-type N-terminal cleavage/methylation domain-containing protein [Pseudomonadota bacterium]